MLVPNLVVGSLALTGMLKFNRLIQAVVMYRHTHIHCSAKNCVFWYTLGCVILRKAFSDALHDLL